MAKLGGFWHRFSSALVSASVFISPLIFVWLASTSHFNSTGRVRDLFLSVGFTEFIAIVTIFLVALPVEALVSRMRWNSIQAALVYLPIGAAVFGFAYLLTVLQVMPMSYLPGFITIGALLGTYVAFFGRLIYPLVYKFPKLSSPLAAMLIAATAVAGILVYAN